MLCTLCRRGSLHQRKPGYLWTDIQDNEFMVVASKCMHMQQRSFSEFFVKQIYYFMVRKCNYQKHGWSCNLG